MAQRYNEAARCGPLTGRAAGRHRSLELLELAVRIQAELPGQQPRPECAVDLAVVED